MSATKTLIIGVGNIWRRDDGAGPAVIRALTAKPLPAHFHTLEHHGEGLALMDAWQDYQQVLMVDAIRARAPAGTLYRFDTAHDDLPLGLFNYSSHQFGLAEAVALARNMGYLPARLIVYGIVGADFSHGEALSAPVAQAVNTLSAQIESWLAADFCAG